MSDPLFYLCPYRFTADPPAMIKFYETLGLVTSLDVDREARPETVPFAVLRGRGGRLGVHNLATSGASTTSSGICFETPDADLAADHCRRSGLEASVIDESFGRRVDVHNSDGRAMTINEETKDFYGYREGASDARPTMDVVAAWFTDDFAPAAMWFEHFGFTTDDHENERWRDLRGGHPSAGVIGLHSVGDANAVDTMDLGFESTESLDVVLERLQAAGYGDATITAEGSTHISVTDPDGFPTEIHPSPIVG